MGADARLQKGGKLRGEDNGAEVAKRKPVRNNRTGFQRSRACVPERRSALPPTSAYPPDPMSDRTVSDQVAERKIKFGL